MQIQILTRFNPTCSPNPIDWPHLISRPYRCLRTGRVLADPPDPITGWGAGLNPYPLARSKFTLKLTIYLTMFCYLT